MRKLEESLREAPATVPALPALALFVIWAGSQAGYPLTHWAPGGLIVLALLAIALSIVRLHLADVPAPVRVALGCLAAYTALSFLSILWAAVPGDAWEGANRTLLYLLVFALFALWPQRGSSAALLLGAWTLAMIALAGYVVLHVDAQVHLARFFNEGRLHYPAGYENAAAATWAMAMWPALLLARSESVPWGVRGLLAGGTVLLGDLALLSLSRGSLYATAAMLVLVFVLLPARTRTFATLVPVAAGIGATVPAVLRVGDRLKHGGDAHAALHVATAAMFAAAAAVALVVALGAAIENRRTFSQGTARRVRRGVGAVAIATLLAVVAGGWVAAGDPVARVRHAWDTFKSVRGYAANGSGNRLFSGLGSDRYDFYRVALDEFSAHPLVGIGADNFQQQYLAHARGGETPRYPHSVELRTLTQTGLAGALLALVGLGAALLAGARALRRSDPLGRVVAAAALGGFAYWVLHGSVDWLWEFAGLGAPAFALLGLACALAPPARGGYSPGELPPDSPSELPPNAQRRETTPSAALRARAVRWSVPVVLVIVALAAGVSLTLPWLSQRQVQNAARVWVRAPAQAYARLDDAASLNPLSDEPYLVAGSIALRFGDLARAEREFSLALTRVPHGVYATLELGAIASSRGERGRALELLEKTVRLYPRDSLARAALGLVRKGKRVSVEELNRSILREAQQFV
jgi:tetratricopeptide (TPR) repeat protein